MKIISETVVFVWDKGNKDKNAKKHGVTNEESEQAFTQGRKFFVRDEDHSTDEDRFILWGETMDNRLLSIIFTIRSGNVRIISARDMNKKERRAYAEKIQKNTTI